MADPIVVNASPTPAMTTAAVRQAILGLAGALTAFGAANWGTTLGSLAVFAGPIAFLVTFVLGQIHTHTAATNQAAMASLLPNNLATTK